MNAFFVGSKPLAAAQLTQTAAIQFRGGQNTSLVPGWQETPFHVKRTATSFVTTSSTSGLGTLILSHGEGMVTEDAVKNAAVLQFLKIQNLK